MRLEGKVAVVSGGASGIGAAVARRFVEEGAAVVIGDIQDDKGEAIAAELVAAGGCCRFQHLDVTDAAQWEVTFALAESAFAKLDILVNNAAIGVPRHPDARPISLEELPEETWDRVLTTNVKSCFLGVKHAIPAFRRNGGGAIVNMSSIVGIVGARNTAYGTSKGAIRLFTKNVAVELAPINVRCNSVHPGSVVTPMTAMSRGDLESAKERLESSLIKRYGEPEEIASGVLYLASDEAAFVAGAELVIDGGRLAL